MVLLSSISLFMPNTMMCAAVRDPNSILQGLADLFSAESVRVKGDSIEFKLNASSIQSLLGAAYDPLETEAFMAQLRSGSLSGHYIADHKEEPLSEHPHIQLLIDGKVPFDVSRQQYQILGLLADGTERHGLQISRETRINQGSIYVQLSRMQKYGILYSRAKKRPEGIKGPPYRMYRVSDKGHRLLRLIRFASF